jgi:hypothetical protein
MSKVHTFSPVTELLPGFRIPFQYLGGGEDPEPRAIPEDVLLEWILENIGLVTSVESVSDGGTISIPGGTLIQVVAVKKAVGARTIQIGTTAGGAEILDETDIDSNADFSAEIHRYTSTNLTLHFTLTGGSVQVLIFKRS